LLWQKKHIFAGHLLLEANTCFNLRFSDIATQIEFNLKFSRADHSPPDNSGSVNVNELKNLVYDLGFFPDAAEIGAIHRSLDKDKSGFGLLCI
jgi:hypothetical protein